MQHDKRHFVDLIAVLCPLLALVACTGVTPVGQRHPSNYRVDTCATKGRVAVVGAPTHAVTENEDIVRIHHRRPNRTLPAVIFTTAPSPRLIAPSPEATASD